MRLLSPLPSKRASPAADVSSSPSLSSSSPIMLWRKRTNVVILMFGIFVVTLNMLLKFRGSYVVMPVGRHASVTNQLVAATGVVPREVSTTTTTTTAANHTRVVVQHHHQRMGTTIDEDYATIASRALQQLERDIVMTTVVSSRDHVLENGFPRTWRPCSLGQQVQRANNENRPVNVVLLGASASARPGSNCSHGEPDGRYASLLQSKLDAVDGINNINVINLAQGGITSTTSALLLDEYINVNTTDVIIWEFLINDDASGGYSKEQARKLDFWLTRVKAHFALANKPPPPILLLHLWGSDAGGKLQRGKTTSMDRNAMNYTSRIIDSYNDRGWNIAVANVGAAINATLLKEHYNTFLDDGSHPSCMGTHFIADMIQHAILTNLASTECTSNNNPQPLPSIPPHKHIVPATKEGNSFAELWNDLFDEHAKVSSISSWEPKVPSLTTFHMINYDDIDRWNKEVVGGKEGEGREDRKYGYQVPKCGQGQLEFVLEERNLKWLGFSQGGGFVIRVNDHLVAPSQSKANGWCFGATHISQWIPLYKHVPKASTYHLQLCTPGRGGEGWLKFLVGVSVPPPPPTTAAAAAALASDAAVVVVPTRV